MSKRKTADMESTSPNDLFSNGPVTFTHRKPDWAYLQLELVRDKLSDSGGSTTGDLDALTTRTYLTSALSQFLGISGTAIPIDILKLENPRPGPSVVWIRVPHADSPAVITALGSWIGGDASRGSSGSGVAFKVKGRGGMLSGLTSGSGMELFVP